MEQFLLSFVSAGIGATIATFLLKIWLTERIRQSIAHEYATQLEHLKAALQSNVKTQQEVWLLKRDACLKALNLANAVLSNYTYQNIAPDAIVRQFETVSSAWACFNELACTCERAEVLSQLKRILFGKVSPDAIVDLRNAVRRELGFSNVEIDDDREKAFIGKLNCDPSLAASQDSKPGSPP